MEYYVDEDEYFAMCDEKSERIESKIYIIQLLLIEGKVYAGI